MIDALFIKVFFHIGVVEFNVVITSNFLDLKLKFLFLVALAMMILIFPCTLLLSCTCK